MYILYPIGNQCGFSVCVLYSVFYIHMQDIQHVSGCCEIPFHICTLILSKTKGFLKADHVMS